MGKNVLPPEARTGFSRCRPGKKNLPVFRPAGKKRLVSGSENLRALAPAANQERQPSEANKKAAGRLRDEWDKGKGRILARNRSWLEREGIKIAKKNLSGVIDVHGLHCRLGTGKVPNSEHSCLGGACQITTVPENEVNRSSGPCGACNVASIVGDTVGPGERGCGNCSTGTVINGEKVGKAGRSESVECACIGNASDGSEPAVNSGPGIVNDRLGINRSCVVCHRDAGAKGGDRRQGDNRYYVLQFHSGV